MIPLLLGVLDSAKSGHLDAHVLLQSQTVGAGGAASITFSSIPQGYRALQLRSYAQSARSSGIEYDDMAIVFNSDASNNYSNHHLYGNGASASSDSRVSAPNIILYSGFGDQYAGSWWAPSIVDIIDYANSSKSKTLRAINGTTTNGSSVQLELCSGAWMSLSAVTSITISATTGSAITQYSRFDLYGIA